MEKILVVGCQRTMDSACIACSRCHVAFNRREGEFARYGEGEAELLGVLGCGDCPGAAIVPRLALMRAWNEKLGEIPTRVHLGPCVVDHCPYRDDLLEKIHGKAGVEVVCGTHPYIPKDVFAP